MEPKDLFLTAKITDHCFASQQPRDHYKANGRMAWDVVCNFGGPRIGQFTVIAPDFRNEKQIYKVTAIYYSKDTGNTMDLTFGNKRWTIGHLSTKKKVGDVLVTGQVLGQTDLSGVTTGFHSHVELWIDGINVDYSTRSQALDNYRKGKLDSSVKIGQPIYFTSYNIGDTKQNDSSPYVGASGVDLRSVKNPIALTVDIRNLYGIKLRERIKLNGPCPGIYEVHDEMGPRFRTSCIQNQGVCIKGDIAIPLGAKATCSGVYTITKI